MRADWLLGGIAAAGLLAAAAPGCRRAKPPATQPTPTAGAGAVLAAESLQWTQSEACARLSDPRLAVSAAVRLVRLSPVTPLCVPAELANPAAARLRVLPLDNRRWVLGLADPRAARRLRAPVVISAEGEVELAAEGVEEEVLVLHAAEDPDVFPHLAVYPDRVLTLDEPPATALALEPEQAARFELREREGFPYIALLPAAGDEEAAEYRWNPYEFVFEGPAVDVLPDPPGGRFHLDLKASELLVPMGGELPEPKPLPEPPPGEPGPMQYPEENLPA